MREHFLQKLYCNSQEFSDKLASLLQRGYLESSGEGLCLSKRGEAVLASLEQEQESVSGPQSPSHHS
ncbi:hypothetical protein [Thiohalorhabdus methylotrophus]|uniref:Uncharacterized protein n=1 Tax=Thiohalorhabdus methylotrophus TaxID=3242694 RepID=A0ABV4U032_9GAMM